MKKYKLGQKVSARVISVDPILKKVALSLKPHMIEGFSMSNKKLVKRLAEFKTP